MSKKKTSKKTKATVRRTRPKAGIDGLLSLLSTSGEVHRVEEAGEGGRTVERWVTRLNS